MYHIAALPPIIVGTQVNVYYEVHSTIIFPGSWFSGFVGNLRVRKTNNAQTKRANTTGVEYKLQVSTGSGVNSVLPFLLISIYANFHIFLLSIVDASRYCCRGLPLT